MGVRYPPSVVVVGSGWQFVSGISYYTWHLVRALREQRYPVSVVLMRNLLPHRWYPGRERIGASISRQTYDSDVPVLDGVDWWVWPSLFRAARFLAVRKPDIVIFQWWTGTVLHSYFVLALAARLLGAKVVIEFHEVLDTGELRVPGVRSYVALLSKPLVAWADGLVLHSEHDRQLLASNYRLRDLPYVVAPHGPYDHHLDRSPSASSLAPASDTGDVCRLLFFGTIRPYKGLEHLIAAFDLLSNEEVEGFRLTVVGETWEGWTLPARMIAESRHRDRIQFVNRYVDDAEAAAAFAAADAVVLPYVRSSASGPLHLAMSHGLPVVVTAVGGLVEAAEGYTGAILVPPADPPRLSEAIRALPGLVGTRHADPHSWSVTVSAIARLHAAMTGHSAASSNGAPAAFGDTGSSTITAEAPDERRATALGGQRA